MMLVLLVAVALAGGNADRTAKGTPQGVSPHGDPGACEACHLPAAADPADGDAPEGDTAQPAVGAPKPIVETCRTCHPTADMHIVGVKPVDVPVPERFPLADGVMTCATCHQEPAHAGVEAGPKPWHRGGPYLDKLDLCYACHEREDYTRSDPHHGKDEEGGGCAACHTTAPDEGAAPEAAKLRLALDETCATCHPKANHLGVTEHVGKVQERPTDLPRTEKGEIACWTCHDVHNDAAVTARDLSPLAEALREGAPGGLRWPGSAAEEHPPMLALPIDDGSLCRSCHGDGP